MGVPLKDIEVVLPEQMEVVPLIEAVGLGLTTKLMFAVNGLRQPLKTALCTLIGYEPAVSPVTVYGPTPVPVVEIPAAVSPCHV